MRGWFGDYLADREVPGRGLKAKRPGPKTVDATPPNGSPMRSLIKLARSRRFDFLAYLLAMALKESRRLSGQ
jgi:hypothetical protein